MRLSLLTVFLQPAKYINIILSPLRCLLLKLHSVKLGRSVLVLGRVYVNNISGKIKLGNNVRLVSAQANHEIGLPSAVVLTTKESGSIFIGDNSVINGATLRAAKKITIGKDVWITSGCFILDAHGHSIEAAKRLNEPHDFEKAEEVIIGDKVWIGINSIVLPGVTIGEGAVIGTGSVVTHNIPANSLAAGVPAKVISTISSSVN